MLEDLLQYDFLNKNINKIDINNVKKIVDAKNMQLSYFKILHENRLKFKNIENFENERFYCLSLNRSINYLQLSFMNVFYYRNMSKSILPKYKVYRLKDSSYYEELYFYYFFITIDNIFKIFDKTAIVINDCFDFGLDNKDNKFNSNVIKKMKTIQKENTHEINNYLMYMKDYEKSIFHNLKEIYRNKNTHDFTNEIPKYRIKDKEIYFDESMKIEESYNDLMTLFNELKKYIKLFDDVVIYSIKIRK
jgi:hypothetical protein